MQGSPNAGRAFSGFSRLNSSVEVICELHITAPLWNPSLFEALFRSKNCEGRGGVAYSLIYVPASRDSGAP